jgi:hypothetical protein
VTGPVAAGPSSAGLSPAHPLRTERLVLLRRGSSTSSTPSTGRALERLGFRREADFVENEWVKGEWTDEAVYVNLASEWALHHPPPES